MSRFDNPIYDESRRWIQRKYEHGTVWSDIKKACKQTDEELLDNNGLN